MTMRRLPLALAVAAGVAAAGCGASSTDGASASGVEQTVRTALGYLAAGDGRGFCSLATRAERARLATEFAARSCSEAIHAVGSGLTPVHRAALRHADVTTVTISGATATVKAADITTTSGSMKGFLSGDGRPTTLVRRAGGRWIIGG
ncbi:MAG TPA: hypothetical protein VG325_19395 [Solirubrobacteraceae bacterium]|nr:hypothetical protein [Solirubrobacteraceae bacterium]